MVFIITIYSVFRVMDGWTTTSSMFLQVLIVFLIFGPICIRYNRKDKLPLVKTIPITALNITSFCKTAMELTFKKLKMLTDCSSGMFLMIARVPIRIKLVNNQKLWKNVSDCSAESPRYIYDSLIFCSLWLI